MIKLNVLAPSRLALAAIPGFVERGRGALINISSAAALAPERSLSLFAQSPLLVISRKAEAKLNALPQFVTNIDGVDIQFVHVR